MTSPRQPAASQQQPPVAATTVTQPDHPVYALTTYELRDYRRDLERAINRMPPDAPAQAGLRARLDAVTAEQEDRARLAAGA